MTTSKSSHSTPHTDALELGALPPVPTDTKSITDQAAQATRHFPDQNRAEGILGLRELAAAHPGELGDLAPDAAECGRLAGDIERLTGVIERLDALLNYASALRQVREDRASVLLSEGEEQITARITRGKLSPESYPNARKFISARGEAVSEGIARAKALKESAAQKPQGT